MRMHKNLGVLLLATLAVLPMACGKDNRDQAQDQEMDRDLNMALKGDTTQGVFQDTTQGMAPSNEGAVQPAPTPSPTTRRPNPTPQPAPVRHTTDRTPAPAPVANAPRTVTSTAPAGSVFAVTLNQTLSTRTNSAGDGFTATLQDPIMDSEGHVLIPAGAIVRGRITGVHASGNVTQAGVINLAMESISYGGHSYPLDASVIEAHADKVTRQSTGTQAGKVAVGAAAGAVLGRVLGHGKTSSTIKGAVIGAAAGTAVAMGTADVDAVLRQGSTMRIRLDGPISVRRTVS